MKGGPLFTNHPVIMKEATVTDFVEYLMVSSLGYHLGSGHNHFSQIGTQVKNKL